VLALQAFQPWDKMVRDQATGCESDVMVRAVRGWSQTVKLATVFFLLTASCAAQNLGAFNGQCALGGQSVIVSGLPSVGTEPIGTSTVSSGSGVIASYPECTVTVYLTGTLTLASLYSNNLNSPTAKANPFTANTDGSFLFYAASQVGYDITITTSSFITLPNSFTLTDVILCNQNCGASGGTLTIQTNGTNTSNQSLLNFLNANSCTWSNPSGGIIEVSCSGSSGVTGSGTVSDIPIWTGTTALGNSVISQTSVAGVTSTAVTIAPASGDYAALLGNSTQDLLFVIGAPGSSGTISLTPAATESSLACDTADGCALSVSSGTASFPALVKLPRVYFASIGTPTSINVGSFVYCVDCTPASNPCTGGGFGAYAFIENTSVPSTIWKCPF
jgi:hypothetical protein